MRARNPLYIMAKPPPEVQAQIAALPLGRPRTQPRPLPCHAYLALQPPLCPARVAARAPLKPWRRAGRLRCGPTRKIRLSYIIPPCFKLAGEQHPSLTARHPSAAARQAIAIGLNFSELWMQGARPASPESVAARARYRRRRRSHVNVTGRHAMAPITRDKRLRRGLLNKDGGPSRNRTGVYGFAVRCVTTPPSGLRLRIAWRQRP